MEKKYSIALRNHFKALCPTLIVALVLYLIIFFGNDFQHGYFASFILIIIIFPSLFVHLSYLIEDYKKEVIIDQKDRVFKYRKDDNILEYKFHELKNIIKCNTLLNRFPFAFYHYFKIIPFDGEEMIVTCLIFRKFPINQKQIEEGLKIFPFV